MHTEGTSFAGQEMSFVVQCELPKNRQPTIKATADPLIGSDLCRETRKTALCIAGVFAGVFFVFGSTATTAGILIAKSIPAFATVIIVCLVALYTGTVVIGMVIAVKVYCKKGVSDDDSR